MRGIFKMAMFRVQQIVNNGVFKFFFTRPLLAHNLT